MKLQVPALLALVSSASIALPWRNAERAAPVEDYFVAGVAELFPSLDAPDMELVNAGDWRTLSTGARFDFGGYVLVPSSEFDALIGRMNNLAYVLESDQDEFEMQDVRGFLESAGLLDPNPTELELKAADVVVDGVSEDIFLEPIYTLPGSGRWKHSANFLELTPVVKLDDPTTGEEENFWVVAYEAANTQDGGTLEYQELHSTLVKRKKPAQ